MENINKHIFTAPITEIIKKRISVRSYSAEPLQDEIKKALVSYFNEVNGPFDSKVRFKLIDTSTLPKDTDIKLGTYGVIRGASSFIISAVTESDFDLEELGYEFEKVILFATSLGLGTCWLGGTFKKGEFAKSIDLKDNETLLTVSPVGIESSGKNLLNSFIRFAAGSKNRKQWNELFFNENFNTPLTEKLAANFSTPLEMVRIAPSASNKQPWRIVKDKENLHFYLCPTKGYGKALGYDIQRVDIGIALCHFELTCRELEIKGQWKRLDKNNIPSNEDCKYVISWTT